jgi:hypothetical protein
MAIGKQHPLHERRKRSNLLLGGVLVGFVALVFAITVVKMMGGASLEGYDHAVRYSIEPKMEPSN